MPASGVSVTSVTVPGDGCQDERCCTVQSIAHWAQTPGMRPKLRRGSTSSGSNLRDRLTVAVPAWMGLQRADSSPESLLHPPSEPSWQGQGTAPIDPLVGRDLLAGWLFSAVFLR